MFSSNFPIGVTVERAWFLSCGKTVQEPLKAIAPSTEVSIRLLEASSTPSTPWPWAGSIGFLEGLWIAKFDNLYTFWIFDISVIWLRVVSSNVTWVPSTASPRCFDTVSCVISGLVLTFTTRRSVVESAIPNRRKASAIYVHMRSVNSAYFSHSVLWHQTAGNTNIIIRAQSEHYLWMYISRL